MNITNPYRLDLTHTVWSMEELEKLSEDKMDSISESPTDELETTTLAIESIAQKELKLLDQDFKITNEDSSSEQLNDVLKQKLYLKNIKRNLVNHDKLINKANLTYHLSIPTHQKTIEKIKKKALFLDKIEKQIKLKRFSKCIYYLEKDIKDNNTNLDITLLNFLYHRDFDFINHLSKENRAETLAHFYSLLNTNFTMTAMDVDSVTHKQLIAPVEILITNLGFEEEINNHMEEIKKERRAILESRLNDKDFLTSTPHKLVSQIQLDILEKTLKFISMKEDEKISLTKVLQEYFDYEKNMIDLSIQNEEDSRKEFKEIILNDLSYSEEQKKLLLNELDSTSFLINDLIFDKMLDILVSTQKEKKTNLLTNFSYKIQEKQNKLSGCIPEKFFKKEIDKALKKFKKVEAWGWFKNNESDTCFRYSQKAWGSHEILGTGICQALNYRWIKKIMENPSSHITDVGYFAENLIRKGKSDITSRDRMDYAIYSVEGTLKEGFSSGIGKTILKRDKLDYQEISTTSTIREMIDSLYKDYDKTLVFSHSGGVFEINAQRNESGHALGMQIDPAQGVYRFWDVNSGFYQYNSREELTAAFEDYMTKFYNNKYTYFVVCQYIPTDSHNSPPLSQ